MGKNIKLSSNDVDITLENKSGGIIKNIQVRTLSKDSIKKIKKIKGEESVKFTLNKNYKEKISPLWLDVVYKNDEKDTYGILASLSEHKADIVMITIEEVKDGQLILNIENK